jgi:hypothetical protein
MNKSVSQVHEVLLDAGYKADSSNEDRILSKPLLYFKEKPVNGPACESEEKPPRILVEVFQRPIQKGKTDNAVMFSLCGERDWWTQISVYAVKLEELEESLSEIEKRLSRMWRAFFITDSISIMYEE